MEPTPEEAAVGLGLVHVLAAVLERLVNANAHIARSDQLQVTKFHALKAPGIGLLQYLERIHKYASCSNECFILALIYIDRLIQRNNFVLTELNVHRVVITAILLAAKFFDDAYYNNAYYAKVGGVLVSEMNGLEVDFLFRINFSLRVTPEVFQQYRAELMSHSVSAGLAIQLPELDVSMITGCRTSPETVICAPAPSHCGPIDMAVHNPRLVAEVTPPPEPAPRQIPVQSAGVATTEPMVDMQAAYDYFPQGQQFLQRANSMPITRRAVPNPHYQVPHPTNTGCAERRPLSAPMVAMVTDGVGLSNCVESLDQYIVLDNPYCPIQNTLIHHHHGLGVDGYQEAFRRPENAHFLAGQMLAGISSGL